MNLQIAIILSIFGAFIITIVYTYLYLAEKETFFAFWAVAWFSYLIRFSIELTILSYESTGLRVLLEFFTVLSAMLLIIGIYKLTMKKFHYIWFLFGGISFFGTAFLIVNNKAQNVLFNPDYFCLGFVYLLV